MTGSDRTEQLSAFLDGELPPAEVAILTQHLATCPHCARQLAELAALRAALAEAVPEEEISAVFLGRVTGALDDAIRMGREEEPARAARVIPFRPIWKRPAFRPVAAGILGAMVAATVILSVFPVLPRHDNSLDLAAVRDATLRGGVSLAAAGGEAASVAGYRLIGARADIIAGHKAEVRIYERDGVTITLCLWKANGEPAHGVREATFRGMRISYWNDGSSEYWAASVVPAKGLETFVSAVRQS